jgi:hypothetical protein
MQLPFIWLLSTFLILSSCLLSSCKKTDDEEDKDKEETLTAEADVEDPGESVVPADACPLKRGMWVWDFENVVVDLPNQDKLLAMSQEASVTDLYVFLMRGDYLSKEGAIRAFISKFSAAGIRVWGLEGYRAYFSDASGPAALYAAADALIAYNNRVPVNERFVGFHNDMEPQDGQGNFPKTFHNDIKDSALDRNGGGVWRATAAEDREKLLEDWLIIEETLKDKLQSVGLLSGAAMPSWTDEYYGENVSVTYKGVRQGVMEAMMGIVDEYVIMSYNTSPRYVADRIKGELSYADTLPLLSRPKVYGAIETHAGVGNTVSYADTPLKMSRARALRDALSITYLSKQHASFCGIALHDWVGWQSLNP